MKYILKVFLLTVTTVLSSCDTDETCSQQVWYEDADGDSFGNPNLSIESCDQPTNYVLDNNDCDDNNSDSENNCTKIAWVKDADNDNHYLEGSEREEYQNWNDSEDYVEEFKKKEELASDVDCDDNNFNINPSAEEIPDNDIDENCDGVIEQTVFPYQVGNKWYYEEYNNPDDILIYESVAEELVWGDLMAKIKVTDAVMDDDFSYIDFDFEFNPDYYQYVETVTIFGKTVNSYASELPGLDTFRVKKYSIEFGLMVDYFSYQDEYVSWGYRYVLKGCIINGVSYGNTSLLN